ncbi:GTPase domain-containing protein [Actinomyces faecalis]|uniref:GTPase domain-containing protein n=1 Tax=Actinomyces faecalis TaxID=2722820 RepID=UPI001556F6AE|nr:GTPase domain-containing protein [Actinomyces faecalis]
MVSTVFPSPAGQGDRPWALSRGRLIDILTHTVHDLAGLDLTLEADGVAQGRRLRDSLTGQIRDHILPRLQDADVPAVVVVGGSTGAGKSTLVNSVLGTEVSDAGVLRPTTRTPVLVVNPEDAEALDGHPVAEVCRLVTSAAVPAGLTLIDASDLDSVQETNRALASRLLEAADLWLFVTTAARYGDLTPWTTLEDAARRGTPIAVVLNRAPAKVLPEVRRDLIGRLETLGLSEAPFFVVPDAGPHEGLLQADEVAQVRDWLSLLAGRHRAAGLMRRTDKSLWTGLRADLTELADAVDAQDVAGRALEEASQSLVAQAQDRLHEYVERRTAGEGAPATRWVTLASSGAPLAPLAQGKALRRGWLGRRARARSEALAQLAGDLREVVGLQLSAALTELTGQATCAWTQAGAREEAGTVLGNGLSPVGATAQWARRTAELLAERAQPVKGLDDQALVDLVLAGSAGVEGAAEAARRLGVGDQVEAAREVLDDVLTQALQEAVPEGSALSLVPDTSLASALRLRAGELAPLVRPGGE